MENPKIRAHLELQDRKDKLEQVSDGTGHLFTELYKPWTKRLQSRADQQVMRSLQSLVDLRKDAQPRERDRERGLFTKFF